MKYPAIYIRNNENEIITDSQGNEISSVLDYWKWAHSCLMDNAERGAFAEYLVACFMYCPLKSWMKVRLTQMQVQLDSGL